MELTPQAFDYSVLSPEDRETVKTKTAEIKILVRQTAQGIIEIGQRLIEVKKDLGHGNWLPWLEAEFGWSDRTALNFIRVAERFKSETISDLDIGPTALYLLSAPSTPESARQEAIERAEVGEKITHKAAQELAEAHRKLENKEHHIQALKDQIGELKTQLPTDDIKNKIRSLESELEAERNKPTKVVEKEVVKEVVKPPADYARLKNETEILKQQMEHYKNKANTLSADTSLRINRLRELEKKLEQKEVELAAYDYKQKEIKATSCITEAHKMISKAVSLLEDDRGGLNIPTHFFNHVEAIKKTISLFEEKSQIINMEDFS